MNNQFNVKWNLKVKILTAIFAAILIFTEIKLIKSILMGNWHWFIIIVAILISFALLFILLTPLYIQLDDDYFVLKKLIGKKIISFENIANIDVFKTNRDIQMFGSGGYGGYLGIFSNAQIGKYSAYVGDFSQAFLIQLKNGKKYVFSCENRDLVIETIKNKIV